MALNIPLKVGVSAESKETGLGGRMPLATSPEASGCSVVVLMTVHPQYLSPMQDSVQELKLAIEIS